MNGTEHEELSKVNQQLNNLFSDLWADMEAVRAKELRELAKRDPIGNRLVKLFDKGTNYRFYYSTDGRGRKIRFCYSIHRNVAGYFLGWREVEPAKRTGYWKRDKWIASRKKRRIVDVARNRSEAHRTKMSALKAKKES